MRHMTRLAAAVVAMLLLAGGLAAAGEGIFANNDSPAAKTINDEIDRALHEHQADQADQADQSAAVAKSAQAPPTTTPATPTAPAETTAPAEKPEAPSEPATSKSEAPSEEESEVSVEEEPSQPVAQDSKPAVQGSKAASTGPEPGSDRTTRADPPPDPDPATAAAWTAWQEAYDTAHSLADAKRTASAAADAARGAYDACIESHGGINAPGVRSTYDGRVIVCPAERQAWESAKAAYDTARAPYDAHVRGHDSPYHTALDAWESAMCAEGMEEGEAYHTASPWWMSNVETWTADALNEAGGPVELAGESTSPDPEDHATSWIAWHSQAC